METKASFALATRNPDVLTCIASLSNDEVFTPPALAKKMLDLLEKQYANETEGANIWENPEITFLDPFTKSGVFLREIVARLTIGLEKEIPDLQERVNHILEKQVFGLAITELTSLIARRSVYCSKYADSTHSIGRNFKDAQGNIRFERLDHSWQGDKCKLCGTNKQALDRSTELENYAYPFIHHPNIKTYLAEAFGGAMQFDVIIGNPPYQLNDGGGEGAAAIPLYNRFVQQAKKLEPRFLTMVIPARWYSGGRGLDDFRKEMLSDDRLAAIHDYPETEMCFPGINIRGGVCIFLWSATHSGKAEVSNYRLNKDPDVMQRPLLEPGLDTFVRYNQAISILNKVRAFKEETYDSRVQASNPYGLRSNFSDFSKKQTKTKDVMLFRSRRGSSDDKQVFVSRDQIEHNAEFIDRIKVLVSKASPGGDEYPHKVFSTPLIGPKNSASTETYLIVDFPKNQKEAQNLIIYMQSRFFRFLVSLIKTTQNIARGSFAFVPIQDLSKAWNDEGLYQKYGITKEEAAFIETLVRPMDAEDE